ncbi:MAG TPA: hypothetical protein DCS93_25325 [Microscillaceae bacterium]|nr:hypothetical protein [Microscillaceae bacterium]
MKNLSVLIRHCIILCGLLVIFANTQQEVFGQASEFITIWQTDNEGTSNNKQITIPGYGTNYTIAWRNLQTGDTGTLIGNYNTLVTLPEAGTYEVKISGGTFNRVLFLGSDDPKKLISIENWGNIPWSTMISAFAGCSNMTYNATVAPNLSNVTSLRFMFHDCTSFNGAINNWNTSNITDMSNMFYGASQFNRPLNHWNTGEVTNMTHMFHGASKFNQPIGSWNTEKVTNMSYMFQEAVEFNQAIGTWNTNNVTNMAYMFYKAAKFNRNIEAWNTGEVTNMKGMFRQDSLFNQSIQLWNTHKVTNMSSMFYGAVEFNRDINSWNTGEVTNMAAMFQGARKFNKSLSNWNTAKVTNMVFIFKGAVTFNQSIEWNTSSVTIMQGMFEGASSFNHSLGEINISQVTDMRYMLNNCGMDLLNYNQTLVDWATQNVQNNVTLGGLGRRYCEGNTGRAHLQNNHFWNFVSDLPITCNPEINVQHNGASIASGATFDMGTIEVGSVSANYRFRIENLGNVDLILSDNPPVQLQGANINDFVLVQNQVTSPIAPGSGKVFDLKFSPTQTGTREASLVIYNNDNNENPYIIHLTGQGQAIPEIKIYQNNTFIPSGGSYDMGMLDLNSSSDVVDFDIRNTGSGDLILDGKPGNLIQISGHTQDFTVIQNQVTSPVAPQTSQSFSVRFHPTTVGARSITLLMNHNASGSTYTITISGTGISVPDIHVVYPLSGTDVPSGSTFDLVTNQQAEFLINNLGSAGLILGDALEKPTTAITITGPDAKDFKLVNFSYVFGGGQKVAIFTVHFTGVGVGTRNATVSIQSNDPDENPYLIHLRGNSSFSLVAVEKKKAQMQVVPNPTTDQLTLKSASWRGQTVQINIQDAQGRPVATHTIKQAPDIINCNVAKYKNGWYILIVRFNTQRLEYRFLKR